jgi:hypothetical protein
MYRTRWFRVLALIAGLAGVMYLVVSLFLPSSRRLIFGVDKRNGYVRLVRNHVTFLPPHRYYRLEFDQRDGAAQRDGLVRIRSKEGVPVTVSYRLRFNFPGTRLPDSQRLVRDGWSAWIRTRVGEAMSAVTQQFPIEELLSPTSQFARQRGVLRQVVTNHLARSGLKVTAFEISRMEPDRRSLLEYKRGELRREARGVAGRVVIFAIDGADWELITELSHDGRIPNLQALARGHDRIDADDSADGLAARLDHARNRTAARSAWRHRLHDEQSSRRRDDAARAGALGYRRGVWKTGTGHELVDGVAADA